MIVTLGLLRMSAYLSEYALPAKSLAVGAAQVGSAGKMLLVASAAAGRTDGTE